MPPIRRRPVSIGGMAPSYPSRFGVRLALLHYLLFEAALCCGK